MNNFHHASLKLLNESNVIGIHLTNVADSVAFFSHTVDAEAKSEPAPLFGVKTASAQHVWMHHSTATKFKPVALRCTNIKLG